MSSQDKRRNNRFLSVGRASVKLIVTLKLIKENTSLLKQLKLTEKSVFLVKPTCRASPRQLGSGFFTVRF